MTTLNTPKAVKALYYTDSTAPPWGLSYIYPMMDFASLDWRDGTCTSVNIWHSQSVVPLASLLAGNALVSHGSYCWQLLSHLLSERPVLILRITLLRLWAEKRAGRTSSLSHSWEITSEIFPTFALHEFLMQLLRDKRAEWNWGMDSSWNVKWDHAECVMYEAKGRAQGQSWEQEHWLTAAADSEMCLTKKYWSTY